MLSNFFAGLPLPCWLLTWSSLGNHTSQCPLTTAWFSSWSVRDQSTAEYGFLAGLLQNSTSARQHSDLDKWVGTSAVRLLVESDASLHGSHPQGRIICFNGEPNATLLYDTSYFGHAHLVQYLIHQKGDPDVDVKLFGIHCREWDREEGFTRIPSMAFSSTVQQFFSTHSVDPMSGQAFHWNMFHVCAAGFRMTWISPNGHCKSHVALATMSLG